MKQVLTTEDIVSPTWYTIKAEATSRIATLQKQLENDLSDEKTSVVRGRIRELRRILSWSEPLNKPAPKKEVV